MHTHPAQHGRSVIELLLVIAILSLLVAVVATPFSNFRKTQALENTTNTVISILGEAHARTLAGVGDTNYGVHLATTAATLFAGSTYSSGASTNDVYTFETPVQLGTVSVNGGGSDVVFDRLKGTTGDYGTISVQISGGDTRTISVTATGSIKRN